MKREITIVRHGETEFNKSGIIQGRGVNSSLNETGKKQSSSFYNQYKNYPFEKIYTSSMKRTKETVSDFADAGFSIESFPELDEINWGIYEGRLADTEMKKEYYKITDSWKNGNLDVKAPNGESANELQNRQRLFFEFLFTKTNHQKILLCIHGRAMRVMLCSLLGKSLTTMDEFPHHNLSLYKINFLENPSGFDELIKVKSEIELFNDLSHLNGKN